MSAFKSTSMSPRDYERVAAVFARQIGALAVPPVGDTLIYGVAHTTLVYTAKDLADTLAASSDPGFRRERFLRACGLKSADFDVDFCATCQHPRGRHGDPGLGAADCAVLLCDCEGYSYSPTVSIPASTSDSVSSNISDSTSAS